MNLMLFEASDILSRFTQPNVIVGIILAIVGLASAILAKRIAKSIRRADKVEENDKYVLGFKIFGLILMLVALIVIVADQIVMY